jgi:hypothetical protein
MVFTDRVFTICYMCVLADNNELGLFNFRAWITPGRRLSNDWLPFCYLNHLRFVLRVAFMSVTWRCIANR